MINWGIIGAGTIAHRFADSLKHIKEAHLYAVSNRTREKAERFKALHPCDKVFDDYDALLKDPAIDAVYIALPHLYHYEWVVKALKLHLPVLCEKPATMSVEEMEQIKQLAQKEGVFFMEAMKSRFEPAYEEAKRLVKEGLIGDVTAISTSLCRVMPEANSSYHYTAQQGGVLYDMGIYNASAILDFSKLSFKAASSQQANDDMTVLHLESLSSRSSDKDGQDGNSTVETYVDALLEVNGVTCRLKAAFDRFEPACLEIKGTAGKITVMDFHRPTSFRIEKDEQVEVRELPYVNDDFYGEITHMMKCLKDGLIESPVMTFEDSIQAARLIALIREKIVKKSDKE